MNSFKEQLSIEELMEIAKHPLKIDESAKLPPVQRFITSDNLEEGSDDIPAALIWDRYLTWTTAADIVALTYTAFFKQLTLHFNKKRKSNGMYYVLSQKGFDMSPEYLEKINSSHVAAKRTSNGKKKQKPTKKNKPGFIEARKTDQS